MYNEMSGLLTKPHLIPQNNHGQDKRRNIRKSQFKRLYFEAYRSEGEPGEAVGRERSKWWGEIVGVGEGKNRLEKGEWCPDAEPSTKAPPKKLGGKSVKRQGEIRIFPFGVHRREEDRWLVGWNLVSRFLLTTNDNEQREYASVSSPKAMDEN